MKFSSLSKHQWKPRYDRVVIEKAPIILKNSLEKDGYKVFKNGWPDFLTVKDGKLRFIEVKERWDVLSKEQIAMMQILSDNGLPCFIWSPQKGLIEFKNYLIQSEKNKIKNKKTEYKKAQVKNSQALGN